MSNEKVLKIAQSLEKVIVFINRILKIVSDDRLSNNVIAIRSIKKVITSNVGEDVYPHQIVTIERCFVNAKTKHAIGVTKYIRKYRMFDDILLLFGAMNLKK